MLVCFLHCRKTEEAHSCREMNEMNKGCREGFFIIILFTVAGHM